VSRLALAVALVCLLFPSAPVAAQTPLAAAKDLYLAAAYEEALAALDRVKEAGPSPSETREIELYRAFCLLALKRQAEAEKAIEALIALDPLYRPQENETAPWVRASFQATRRRVLPSAAQQRYQDAKAAFGRKEYALAATGFQLVLAILKDPDLDSNDAGQKLTDLSVLAQGFLELSQAAAVPAAAQKPAQPPAQPSAQAPAQALTQPPIRPQVQPSSDRPPTQQPAPAPPSAPAASPAGATGQAGPPGGKSASGGGGTPGQAATSAPPIYTSSDVGITPPTPVFQQLPRWPSDVRNFTPGVKGLLELVIDETGQVEFAVVRQGVHPIYDAFLVSAARTWRYKPATRDGKAVKFRKLIEVLGPTTLPGAKPLL
jgi:protein TonB